LDAARHRDVVETERSLAQLNWIQIMNWLMDSPHRPLVLIVLAQNNGQPLDEINLAARAGLLNQQVTGEVVETAVMVKQVLDLEAEGYVEHASDGFRWQMTDLGMLASRQWAPGEIGPQVAGPLEAAEIRGWRDRVIEVMDHDAKLAEKVGIDKQEWIMTQSQRLVELQVLNRVLGEESLPEWLVRMRVGSGGPNWTEEERDSEG